jgi:hypothetical protein
VLILLGFVYIPIAIQYNKIHIAIIKQNKIIEFNRIFCSSI